MPRLNSQNWAVDDQITAPRLQDFNLDIDTLFASGNDRGRVFLAVSETALMVDIGAFTYRVGSTTGTYAGTTDLLMTDNATNYVEINTGGSVTVNQVGWDSQKARLAAVITSGGAITSITINKPDVIGGNLGGNVGLLSVTTVTKDKFGRIITLIADGVTYTITYVGNSTRMKTVTNGSVTATLLYDVNMNFIGTTVV